MPDSAIHFTMKRCIERLWRDGREGQSMEKRQVGGRIAGIMLAHEYIEMLYWSKQSYPEEGGINLLMEMVRWK